RSFLDISLPRFESHGAQRLSNLQTRVRNAFDGDQTLAQSDFGLCHEGCCRSAETSRKEAVDHPPELSSRSAHDAPQQNGRRRPQIRSSKSNRFNRCSRARVNGPLRYRLIHRAYVASTILTALSSWNVSTVSAGTLIDPPLVAICATARASRRQRGEE